MKINQNFHIHSHHSCDSAKAAVLDIISEMKDFGIGQYGLTDHLHTTYNLPDIVSARRDFLSACPPTNFHFGIEVSVVDEVECERIHAGQYHAWGDEPVYGLREIQDFSGRFAVDLPEDAIQEQHIEFVVGGIHWPLTISTDRDELIRNYFELHLFLVNNQIVDVLAHPWDSLELAVGGWFKYRDAEHVDRTCFKDIPQEYNDRLAEALIAQGKPAELNIAVLTQSHENVRDYYYSLFCSWKERGVKFTIGSDLHDAHFSKEKFAQFEKDATRYGFTEDDIVLPHFRTF